MAKREEDPLIHTHTLPDLLSPIPRQVGTTQVPGSRPGTTCPIWDPPACSLPCPKAAYLPPENRVADGTWGAQVAEAGQCCEPCAVENGGGGGRGEPPTWRAETGTSRRLQGTGLSWARGSASQGSHGHSLAPQGRASPGWRPRPHRERAGTSCVCSSS